MFKFFIKNQLHSNCFKKYSIFNNSNIKNQNMKIATILFMALYLYALTYGIFLTELFRIPAPLIFCLPLIILFREKHYNFYYRNELWVLSIAVFLYYAVGISEIKSFSMLSSSYDFLRLCPNFLFACTNKFLYWQ